MPIFEYRCSVCAHLEEVLQKHSDPAPETCPACGKAGTLAKELSLTSFQLKGGGWYKDLYSSTTPAAGKSDSSSGEKKTDTSSDTKTATKTEKTTEKKTETKKD